MSSNKMEYLILIFVLNNFFPTSFAQSENSNEPKVTIPQGNLQGTIVKTYHGRNISAFLGIPYARPPTGNLRFVNPIPDAGWNGTRNASIYANVCTQISADMIVGDEDCLYLNVYTPQVPESLSPSLLPVMVYIHGGAFIALGSSEFEPQYLLDEDVILVTMNYRLGPFGFLSTGDDAAYGNYGLKDQVLALKWVKNNVEYFGGDPDRVTLFGQSAGAVSVHLLSLSNATIGLFHKYITHSGSALATWAYRPRAAYASRAFELGGYVGCSNDTSHDLINCLRKVSSSDIVATYVNSMDSTTIVWGPTDEPDIEGAVLTDSPTNLFASGQIRDLPWICGCTRDEGLQFTLGFYENEQIFDDFLENLDSLLPVMLSYTYLSDKGAARVEAIKSFYFNDLTANKSLLIENSTKLFSDATFIYPAYDALKQQLALAKNPQYFYTFHYEGTFSFTYTGTGTTVKYGVTHSDELMYLFPFTYLFSGLNKTMSETDYEMVDTMVKLWTSFAINGTPSVTSLDNTTAWTQYSTADNYFQIGDESNATLQVKNSFLKERMQFWANLDQIAETSTVSPDNSGSSASTASSLLIFLFICSICTLSLNGNSRFVRIKR